MKLSSEIGGGHVLHAPSGHGLFARCGQVPGLLQTAGRITPAVVGTIALDAGAPLSSRFESMLTPAHSCRI